MIVLTGANGVVGYPLRLRLLEQGQSLVAVSRKPSKEISLNALQWNLERAIPDKAKSVLADCDSMIHCAPIWLLPTHLKGLHALGLKRLIVFSSTSVLSKHASANPQEQKLVSQLANAEENLQKYCVANEINLTILRPSLIYGHGRDQNVMHIAGFIRRFGFMVLVGQANGKRQPVHADDLVEVCCRILNRPETYGKVYNLAGAEVLSYRAMVERIFTAMNKKPRIISLPLALFRFALRVATRFTSFAYTAEMADRMNQDLNYSNQAAQQDFAYKPSLFLEQPQRDLNLNAELDQTL